MGGKSTSAQLLGRNHGYVFYESDCFGNIKNPYIPTDAENPSMAQVHQKALKGEGLERGRKRIGGDWAVAGVALTRSVRDHIRSILGQDLMFVILSMDREEVRKRVTNRHKGDEQAADMLLSFD